FRSQCSKEYGSSSLPLGTFIMISAIQKQENGTIQLTITVPAADVKKTREAIVAQYAQAAQVPGFRKGKAPKKLVEERIDNQKVDEELLKTILPAYYSEALKEHKLQPVINPRVHIEAFVDGKDLQFIAETCEAPEVKLGNYKDEIKKITAKGKIVVPGKEPEQISFDQIIGALLKATTMKVPAIIVEQETQRLLSQTLDEVKKLGLTLEQYLSSTGKTSEDLKREYEKKAENDIKIEFALQKVGDTENLAVEQKEIDEAIAKAKDDTERKSLQANSYLLANILRQQKTLDFLRNL
ncbi:MAG: trigger factor, partial [Candidatus Levyibacteriota bacterium]